MFVEQINNKKYAQRRNKIMSVYKIKKVEKHLTKGLLDLVVLGFLRSEAMHGYKIIQNIRRNFGIYFGPSTIYPYLKNLEKNGYIKSQWDINSDRPRKLYHITSEGNSLLTGCEQSFNYICNKLNRIGMSRVSFNDDTQNQSIMHNVSTP
jgi:PadR family transcriptional regulator PadR